MAHYAANASGLVIEFRDLASIFRGDETGVLSRPIPVRYERERLGITFDPRSHESLFFAKFQDWNYEQEVRIVLPLAACRQKNVDGRLLYLFVIEPRCVARIIVGWRMAATTVAKVVKLVQTINPDMEISQARIEKGQVRLGDRLHPK